MLLEALVSKQRARKLTDQQFADELGIPRSTWQLTRSGEKPLGPRVLRAVLHTYPELRREVLACMKGAATPSPTA